MYDPYAEFTKCTLENGLDVYATYWERPWVFVEIVVHAGSKDDPMGKSGLAHFVEHLVARNGGAHPQSKVQDFFASCGGFACFGTLSYLATRFSFKVPNDTETMAKAFQYFGSMLFNSDILNGVEQEKAIVQHEFHRKYGVRKVYDWEHCARKELFKGHRLGHWRGNLGLPSELKKLSRKDVVAFHRKYYVPANTSIVIVGGIKEQCLTQVVSDSPFGLGRSGERNPLEEMNSTLPPPPSKKRKVVSVSQHTSLTLTASEYIATWALPYTFSNQAVPLYRAILGDLLFEEVRHARGLTYDISCGLAGYQSVREFWVRTKVPHDAVQEVEALIHNCIQKVTTEKGLFGKKRNKFLNKCYMLDCSGGGLADNTGDDLEYLQRIVTNREVLSAIHAVCLKDMERIASCLTKDRCFVFIYKP